MVTRRQLLRWAAITGTAIVVGCRPSTSEPAGEAARSRSGNRPRPDPPAAGDHTTAPGSALRQPPPEPDGLAEVPPDPPPEAEPDPPSEPEPQAEPTPDTREDGTEGEAGPEGDPSEDAAGAGNTPLRVEVLCRDGLGLVPARPDDRRHSLTQLTLHHTAVALSVNALAPSRLRGHQRYHMEQGWSDIAYHFAVDLAGNIYELRAVDIPGDTFTDYDPGGHFLVVCEGNYDQQQPTDAMLAATAEILAHGATTYGLGADSLTGHRDHAATTCPGDALQSRLGELRSEVARLAPRGAQRHDVCGQDATALVAAIEAG